MTIEEDTVVTGLPSVTMSGYAPVNGDVTTGPESI
jgi:hypothetical protein